MPLSGAALNKFTLVKVDKNTRKINNNKKVKVKLDTSAEVNVMRMRLCQDGKNKNKALWI